MDAAVTGTCEPRFTQVREDFTRNFLERGEVGASVCVIVDGTTVVDLAGGWCDEQERRPWRPDTLVDFYSVGKAFLALLALQLVDGGDLALDDPIATVWPEFGAAGKESVTLRQALCHRAGVPAIREPLTNEDLWDWRRMTDALGVDPPVVGAGYPARIPHEHLRSPARRGGATGDRRHVPPPARRRGRTACSGRAGRRPPDGTAPLRRRHLRR